VCVHTFTYDKINTYKHTHTHTHTCNVCVCGPRVGERKRERARERDTYVGALDRWFEILYLICVDECMGMYAHRETDRDTQSQIQTNTKHASTWHTRIDRYRHTQTDRHGPGNN
jgi:hypothetical protein